MVFPSVTSLLFKKKIKKKKNQKIVPLQQQKEI